VWDGASVELPVRHGAGSGKVVHRQWLYRCLGGEGKDQVTYRIVKWGYSCFVSTPFLNPSIGPSIHPSFLSYFPRHDRRAQGRGAKPRESGIQLNGKADPRH